MPEHQPQRKIVAKTTNLSADEFKQALLKYNSRQAKSGKSFAVVSVQLVGYESLLARAGEAATRQLINGLRGTLSRICRESDRICACAAEMLLLLLPDISEYDLDKTVAQLRDILSGAARAAAQLRPSFRLQYCPSRERGGDLASVLSAIGCQIDEHGNLVRKTVVAASSDLGSLQSWLLRYRNQCPIDNNYESCPVDFKVDLQEAYDSWKGVKVVVTQLTAQEGQSLPVALQDTLIKRAKVMEDVEHPSLQAISDFFLDDQQRFLFVAEAPAPESLSAFFAKRKVSEEQAVDAILQFLSVLVYAESLVPHLVLPFCLAQLSYIAAEARLLVHDYQCRYLLADEGDQSAVFLNAQSFAGFADYVAAHSEPGAKLDGLLDLARSASSSDPPRQLNTIHKLRAAAKKIADQKPFANGKGSRQSHA